MDKNGALEIASRYVNYLISTKNIAIKKAFLFGSYAKGTQNQNSDIDIAIVLPNQYDTFEMQIQLMLFARNFSLDIEPHPIKEEDFSKSNPMASEIIKTGIGIC
jgi:predicted nucleotidyltransferase